MKQPFKGPWGISQWLLLNTLHPGDQCAKCIQHYWCGWPVPAPLYYPHGLVVNWVPRNTFPKNLITTEILSFMDIHLNFWPHARQPRPQLSRVCMCQADAFSIAAPLPWYFPPLDSPKLEIYDKMRAVMYAAGQKHQECEATGDII